MTDDGSLVTYDPGPGFVGNDFFEYQVCDPGADLFPGNGDDLCATAWVSVVVNGPPEGVDNAYSLQEDSIRVVAAPGVLGNDTDPNGDPLTAWLLGAPTNGALLISVACPTGLVHQWLVQLPPQRQLRRKRQLHLSGLRSGRL